MVALGGIAVALLTLLMPVGLIETIVASSGFSEAFPAAAPPLGTNARLVVAGFAGLMAAGLIGMTRRTPEDAADEEVGKGRAPRVQGAKTMGFAFSKLTALARGRAMPDAGVDMPSLRRADAHPDAPPRPPIFASRDFDGVEIFARPESARRPLVVNREPEAESPLPSATFARPEAPLPEVEAPAPQPAFLRPVQTYVEPERAVEPKQVFAAPVEDSFEPDFEDVIAPAPQPVEPKLAPLPLRQPTQGLSVAQLTDRLERGLALRTRATVPSVESTGVLADMAVPSAVPVRGAVEQDTDEALRAALGALRNLAGRR
ncbi:hypothetical protein SAMN05518866_104112 [Sphingobium sp. YR768]|nr:hypothetical protein [Sphingobium sp. YR768]SER01293.1 hypothetical protein SAMN05518866_104112 [Sphingobium sp. YR768]